MDGNKPRRISPRESVEGPAKGTTSKGDTQKTSRQGGPEKEESKTKIKFLMNFVRGRKKYKEL